MKAAPYIAVLAIIGIVYGALVAMVQPNMKKLVAYSSVSHLGFVVLGIFSFTQQGLDGAVYQMLNHGISTGALFVLVGLLYERRHSLEIADYGGVATAAPWLSTAFLVTTLASIGLPTLNNFVGEFLILQGERGHCLLSLGPSSPRSASFSSSAVSCSGWSSVPSTGPRRHAP